jgi:hypothetical protein
MPCAWAGATARSATGQINAAASNILKDLNNRRELPLM